MSANSFDARSTLQVGDESYEIFRLDKVEGSARLPYSLKVLLENLLRTEDGADITATVRTADRTGIEMEALTAVAVAALALIDMVKAVDKHARITDVRVTAKSGGRSGDWRE